MEVRIRQLQDCESYKEGLRDTCRANKIPITMLNGLTIKRLRVIYARTLQHYRTSPDKAKDTWFENQLRLFHWALLIEAFFSETLITLFDNTHWDRLLTYFPAKNPFVFEYEAKKLLGTHCPSLSKTWSQEECSLLTSIMEDKAVANRWNEVARRFYELSGKRFYRSSKQCREQWFNHLDFSKIHGQWTSQEDLSILEFVLAHGHKWAQMCKQLLPHRTEHMIKNRFKSLLSKAIAPNRKGHISERKCIKHVLLRLKDSSDPILVGEEEKAHNKELIRKQLTFSSEKDLKSEKEAPELNEESSMLRSWGELPKNGLNRGPINQSIIHSGEPQQNQQLQQSQPLALPFMPQLQTTFSNTHLLMPLMDSSVSLPPQICEHSTSQLSIFTFLPNYYTFMTPNMLNFNLVQPQASHEEQ